MPFQYQLFYFLDEEPPNNGRNPSFITSSLPRPQHALPVGEQYTKSPDSYHRSPRRNSRNRKSTDYFIDTSSESESDSGMAPGHPNDAYIDDASSTISDEMFKSTSDGNKDTNGGCTRR